MTRRNKVVLILIGIVALLLIGMLLATMRYTRHQPYAVAPRDRPPMVPEPRPSEGLLLRYLGISCYEISDGKTVIVTDPALTRPALPGLLLGPLESNPERNARLLPRADFILVNHAPVRSASSGTSTA